MVDKNPYEKDEVEVPNFGETEEKGADPIFNMDTTGVSPETDTFNAEEEAESSSKAAVIVLIVLLVLFLVGTVAGLLFGISKSKEVSKVMEEYTAYKTKTTSEITEKDNLIKSLQTQLEEAKAATTSQSTTGEGSSQGTTQTASMTYLMDEGVGVRPSAGDTSKYADYSKLPTDIQNIVYNNTAGKSVTTRNAKFPIYETKQVNGANWGRIADNAWVCIDYGTKQ